MSRTLVTGHQSLVTGYLSLVTVLLAIPAATAAQATAPDSIRSTRAGVYSEAQSSRGREIYALNCMSCHTPASHAGPEFTAKWDGRLFWDLYQFVRESMPKSEPGSLTAREYLSVLAYLLKMNGMPEGPDELPADSTALTRIRIDFKRDSSQQR
jgi:mono/diheme cytochrome c family protein